MHKTTTKFWERFYDLPEDIQTLAVKQFKLLEENPEHPSLHFKKVGDFWSARVNQNYRALAIARPHGFTWVWIGTHDAYERMIN